MDRKSDIKSSHIKEPPWFNSFDELLENSSGLMVFKKFLDKLQLGNCLDFLFACKGIIEIKDPVELHSHVKSVHRRFVMRGNIPCLVPEMSHRISRSVATKDESVDLRQLFVEAKLETYTFLKDNYFRIFLLSPEYLEFVQDADICQSTAQLYQTQNFLNYSKSMDTFQRPSYQTTHKRYNPQMAVADPESFANEISQRIENISINRTQTDERSYIRPSTRPDDILEEHISKIWKETSLRETSIPLNIQPSSCFAQRLNQTARSINLSNERFPYSFVAPAGSLVVGYQFSNEKFPYRTVVNESRITLAAFKRIVRRKGSFRYFFKTACFDFDSSAAFVELFNDSDEVPLWEGKIFSKIFPLNNED